MAYVPPPPPSSYLSPEQREILASNERDFSQPRTIGGQVFTNPNDLQRTQLNLQNLAQDRFLDATGGRGPPPDTDKPYQIVNGQKYEGVAPASAYGPTGPTGVKYSQPGSLTGGGIVTQTGTSQQYIQGIPNKPGVYATQQGQYPAGLQVTITEGQKAQNAGAYIRQLQGGPFAPGRLTNPAYIQTFNKTALEANSTQAENIKGQNPFQPGNGQLSTRQNNSRINFGNSNSSSNVGVASSQTQEQNLSSGQILERLSPFYAIDKAIQERSPFAVGFQDYVTETSTTLIDKNIRGARKILAEVQLKPLLYVLPEKEGTALFETAAGGKITRNPYVGALADSDIQQAGITTALSFVGANPVTQSIAEAIGGFIGVSLISKATVNFIQSPSSYQAGTSAAEATIGALFVKSSTNSLLAPLTNVPKYMQGRPIGDISIRGAGKLEYEGVGQEINAPVNPSVTKITTYQEQPQGILRVFGNTQTEIVEFQGNRYISRSLGGTPETPRYQTIQLLKADNTQPGNYLTDSTGTPVESVVFLKKGTVKSAYDQPAEAFGKISVSTAYNTFKQRTPTEDNPSTFQESTVASLQQENAAQTSTRTFNYRTESNPDKSILTQQAAEERIIDFNQPYGNQAITGKVSAGAESKAISFTDRAPFTAERTPITVSESETVTKGATEKVFGGTTKVELKVTTQEPYNEFTSTRNRLVNEEENTIITSESEAKSPGQKARYTATVNKPLIETAGEKTMNIAGTLSIQPRPQEQTTFVPTTPQRSNTGSRPPLGGIQDIKALPETPASRALRNYDENLAKQELQSQEQSLAKLVKNTPEVTTLEVSKLQSTTPDIEFSIPQAQETTPQLNFIPIVTGTSASVSSLADTTTSTDTLFTPVTDQTPTTATDTITDTTSVQIQQPATTVTSLFASDIAQIGATSQISKTEQASILTQVSQQSQVNRTTNILSQIQNTQSSNIVDFTQEPPTPPVNFTMPKKKKQEEDLYDLFIPRHGRYTPLSFQGLRLSEAISMGESIVENTLAGSFKITSESTHSPASGPARENIIRNLGNNFRTGKNDQNLYVEKAQYRLSTPGEKSEIKAARNIFSSGSSSESIFSNIGGKKKRKNIFA